MIYLLLIIVVVMLIFGPQLWARYVFNCYNTPGSSIPGSGGELVHHLLDRFELNHVGVEPSGVQGDHYDLGGVLLNSRLLTAVVVAAHEVGHALQHAEGYWPLRARTRLAVAIHQAKRIDSLILIAVLTHVPAVWHRTGGRRGHAGCAFIHSSDHPARRATRELLARLAAANQWLPTGG